MEKTYAEWLAQLGAANTTTPEGRASFQEARDALSTMAGVPVGKAKKAGLTPEEKAKREADAKALEDRRGKLTITISNAVADKWEAELKAVGASGFSVRLGEGVKLFGVRKGGGNGGGTHSAPSIKMAEFLKQHGACKVGAGVFKDLTFQQAMSRVNAEGYKPRSTDVAHDVYNLITAKAKVHKHEDKAVKPKA